MTNPVAQLFALPSAPSVPAVARSLSFQLLGPVRAWIGRDEVDLGTRQQRAVLAVLLLADGQPVTVDDVVDRVWGENPPRSARGTLRTYIYRLRRVLESAAPGSDLIQFTASSYRIATQDVDIDSAEFFELLRLAEEVRRFDDRAARDSLRSALALWKGDALQGCDGEWLVARRAWLESRRVDALIALFPLEQSGGEPGGVLEIIGELWRQQPTQEKLAELYMTGLWQKNQRSDALGVYEHVRQVLGSELGIDPGAELQALHLRILRAENTVAGASEPEATRGLPHPARVPAELPSNAAPFVGREREVALLTGALTGQTVRHVGIAGLDGMGKTRLAIRVAHAVRGNFPDGQIFLTVGDMPVADALGDLLATLGIPHRDIPAGALHRAALWRTVTSELRLLLVADDVVDPSDLALLLPSSSRSAIIVTAQRRVVHSPAVTWVRLTPFTTRESTDLMGILAGPARVAAEERTACRLADECSNIPLAVEVAAARLNDRPHWSLAEIEQQLLDDLQSPVVMQEDCRIVDAPLARAESIVSAAALALCHRLAVVAVGAFDAAWAAAQAGVEPALVTRLLEELVDANLLVSEPAHRYAFLSLVQAYTRRQAGQRLA